MTKPTNTLSAAQWGESLGSVSQVMQVIRNQHSQRVGIIRHHRPIEGKWKQAKTRNHTEDLVRDDMFGNNPADPGKIAKSVRIASHLSIFRRSGLTRAL